MLSNCQHTRVAVLPRMVAHLTKHGYLQMDQAMQVSAAKFQISDGQKFCS